MTTKRIKFDDDAIGGRERLVRFIRISSRKGNQYHKVVELAHTFMGTVNKYKFVLDGTAYKAGTVQIVNFSWKIKPEVVTLEFDRLNRGFKMNDIQIYEEKDFEQVLEFVRQHESRMRKLWNGVRIWLKKRAG